MSYNMPPGYDDWKLAYPPHWDDEPEEEEETFDGLTQCLDCGHIWDADQETECEKCGSDALTGVSEE